MESSDELFNDDVEYEPETIQEIYNEFESSDDDITKNTDIQDTDIQNTDIQNQNDDILTFLNKYDLKHLSAIMQSKYLVFFN